MAPPQTAQCCFLNKQFASVQKLIVKELIIKCKRGIINLAVCCSNKQFTMVIKLGSFLVEEFSSAGKLL